MHALTAGSPENGIDMFGKTRDHDDTASLDGPTIEDFFGDETAADEAARLDALRERIVQVESQVRSQFTSLATYVQIAQEQTGLARSEAKAASDRSEQRLTELIERERADRIEALAETPIGSMSDTTARLDALEQHVAEISRAVDELAAQQQALTEAITRLVKLAPCAPAAEFEPPCPAPFPPPSTCQAPDPAGPIVGLSLD